MSGLFQEVEGECAIVVTNGVYQQVPLYSRNGYLFAKVGSGFIRLMADGSTTKAKCRLDYLTFEGELFKDKMGRLCGASVKGAIPLPAATAKLLLQGPEKA